jgi:hypothetical protein
LLLPPTRPPVPREPAPAGPQIPLAQLQLFSINNDYCDTGVEMKLHHYQQAAVDDALAPLAGIKKKKAKRITENG